MEVNSEMISLKTPTLSYPQFPQHDGMSDSHSECCVFFFLSFHLSNDPHAHILLSHHATTLYLIIDCLDKTPFQWATVLLVLYIGFLSLNK